MEVKIYNKIAQMGNEKLAFIIYKFIKYRKILLNITYR